MNYTTFVPAFNDNVVVTQPGPHGPVEEQVNPVYCATDQCASDLCDVFAAGAPGYSRTPAVTVIPGPALGAFKDVFAGGVDISSTVPWLQFFDGTKVRAGQVADYWSHGYTPYYAFGSAIRDYQNAAFEQGITAVPPPEGEIPSQPPG